LESGTFRGNQHSSNEASMNVSLDPELQKFVDEKVSAGEYPSADEVVRAGLKRLMHEDDFAPGELNALIAVGEAELQRGETVDGEEVFRELRELRNQRGGNAK
jgi:antitoxin ParD1/3/4